MVSTCGQLTVVIVVLGNIVIQGCFSVRQTKKNGEYSATSIENRGNQEILEIHKEADRTRNSNEVPSNFKELARKKGDGEGPSMMDQLLPMLIIPFIVSSFLIPPMLLSIKVLMIKSAIIGKIAVILMLLNFFRRRVNSDGVSDHYPMDLANEHYGYQGVAEPGVYVNKKKRRRKRDLR